MNKNKLGKRLIRIAKQKARTLSLGYERRVHGDVVGPAPEALQVDLVDLELDGLLVGEQRIEGGNPHAVGLHPVCDLAADAPESEDAEALALELVARVDLAIPAALLHRLAGLHDVAG